LDDCAIIPGAFHDCATMNTTGGSMTLPTDRRRFIRRAAAAGCAVLLPGFARDGNTAVGQFLLGGVDVAHLQPERAARVRFPVAGQLDQ